MANQTQQTETSASAAAAPAAVSVTASAAAQGRHQKATATRNTPAHFLWGASTAGHQIDGNDTMADTTFLESVTPSVFKEPAGAACMSWERWEDDLDCVAAMGLNAYRFSVEWCRIEPEQGKINQSALDHYDRMIDGCLERGITPAITLSHFTAPHWFAAQGSWMNPQAAGWFADEATRVMKLVGDRVGLVVTFNEPNLAQLLAKGGLPPEAMEFQKACLAAASAKAGVDHYRAGNVQSPDDFDAMDDGFAKAHRAAVQAVRAVNATVPVGLSLSVTDDTYITPHGKELMEAKRAACYGKWVDVTRGDDFIGVQNYERIVYGDDGVVPPRPDQQVNGMGTPVEPTSLAASIIYTHELTGLPIVVTEHGISTDDDTMRCDFIQQSIPPMVELIKRDVPVLGYFRWTLMDNFEWISAFDSRLGLYEVDRAGGTYDRIAKPSAEVYAQVVRQLDTQI